jgi:hypothetical protein
MIDLSISTLNPRFMGPLLWGAFAAVASILGLPLFVQLLALGFALADLILWGLSMFDLAV